MALVGTPLMALSCRCSVRDGIDPASLDAFKKKVVGSVVSEVGVAVVGS